MKVDKLKVALVAILCLTMAMSAHAQFKNALKKAKEAVSTNPVEESYDDQVKNSEATDIIRHIDNLIKYYDKKEAENYFVEGSVGHSVLQSKVNDMNDYLPDLMEKDPTWFMIPSYKTKQKEMQEKLTELDNAKAKREKEEEEAQEASLQAMFQRQEDEKNRQQEERDAELKEHYEDQGMTSAVHEKYVGQIVFSNKEIDKDNPDESSFTNTYTLGDYLAMRFFYPQSIRNYYKDQPIEFLHNHYESDVKETFQVYIDDKEVFYAIIPKNMLKMDEVETWTTKRSDIYNPSGHPGDVFYREGIFYDILVENQDLWIPGKSYDIRMEVHSICDDNGDDPIDLGLAAKGNFTMKVTSQSIEKMKKHVMIGLPKAGNMVDPALSAKILSYMRSYAQNNGWSEDFVKAIIASDGWRIVRNEISSVIVGRTISAHMISKWPDGTCRRQIFTLMQEYDGSKYLSTLKRYSNASQYHIACFALE